MLATVEYEHEPEYAEYIKPARELCMRNLRDPILISAEQLGEALGFVTMAQALRIFGGEMQARQGHSSYLPLGETRAFSPAPRGACLTCTCTRTAHALRTHCACAVRRAGLPPGGASQPTPHPNQVFHREVTSRRGACAYFVGRELSQLPFHLTAPGLAVLVYTRLTQLLLHRPSAYVALGLLMWCAAGVGYAASIALDRLRAPVAGCIVLMVWITTSGYDPSLNLWDSWGLAAVVPSLSPDRWYLELVYISTIRQYMGSWEIKEPFQDLPFYHLADYWRCVGGLVAIGLGLRVVACALLVAQLEPGASSSLGLSLGGCRQFVVERLSCVRARSRTPTISRV